MRKLLSMHWRKLPLAAFFGIIGVLLPFLLYRHSTFFGWSAPRGGETVTILSFLGFLAIVVALFRRSFIVIAMVSSLFLGSIIGFLSPWIQSDPYWAKPDIETPERIWEVKRVAHSGGSIDGLVYTNSLEALDENKPFFDFFELDFSLTSDDELVCLHSWGEDVHNHIFGRVLESPVSLSDFEQLNEAGQLTACTISSLSVWLEQNPEKFIVSDIKALGRNVELLTRLQNENPTLAAKFIPQAYNFQEAAQLNEAGFERVILTTYRMGQFEENDFLEAASQTPLYAVTMTSGQAGSLSSELNRLGIPTYVFTVNDVGWFARLRELAVSNIYTNFLSDTIDGY